MKSRPGQGLTVISKKIRLKQNDHASRRTQRSPHTRREQHPSTLAANSTPPDQHPSASSPFSSQRATHWSNRPSASPRALASHHHAPSRHRASPAETHASRDAKSK